MKVAWVIPGGFERPGVVEGARAIPVLNELAQELSREHEVHVFHTHYDARGGRWRAHGADVHDAGRADGRRGLALARRLRCTVAAVSTEHRVAPFSLVHAFWIDTNGVLALAAARAVGVPLVASMMGGELTWLDEIGYGNARRWPARAMTRWVLARATCLSTHSAAGRRAMVEASGRSVELVPLGPPRARFEHPPRERAEGPHRLIHVGNLNLVKDPSTLLDVMSELVRRGLDVALDQIGFDTLDGRITRDAHRRGLADRVRFHGLRTPDEVAELFARADVNLVTSRHEVGPMTLLEAGLAHTPTVGTRVGLLAELADDVALTADVGDVRTLADHVERLLVDRPLHRALAERAHDWAAERDCEASARRFSALYREVSRSSGR